MSRFNLPSISTSSATTPGYVPSPEYATDDEDEEDNLPYPTELPRSDFLKPDFDPQEYLSSLRNRHQALEDLRSDLRARSQLLNQELLDLVNGNYEEFLSLGSDLSGGEEKVEGVRIGLLGFTKEIEVLKTVVSAREAEFASLLKDAKHTRREILFGRRLLEIEASLESLEDTLGLNGEDGLDDEDSELDEELVDDEETTSGVTRAIRKLSARVEYYCSLNDKIEMIEPGQPFLDSLQPRLDRVRKTLLLDMSAVVRQGKDNADADDLLSLSRMFSDLDAVNEALLTLRVK